MVFKKIIPRSRSSSGDIRVSFSGRKTQYANVYISHSLLNKLQWDKQCRVFLYFDDENPKLWMIERAENNEKDTFKLVSTKGGNSGLSKLQFKFSECKITDEDRKLKVIDYEIKEGKIIISN